MIRYFLAALLAAATMQTVRAADPQINMVAPYGMRRGTTAEWTITGLGFGNSKELMFYTPGFVVTNLEAKGDDTLKATVTVAEDCQLGMHAFRLRSTSGVSNLRTFTVGILPGVTEVEPNNDVQKAQSIPLNVTVSGVVPAEDVDHYSVELKQGERLTVELEGLRLGNSAVNTFFDPFLAILAPDGREVARSDDNALVNQDCLCSFVAPMGGKYVVHLRDISYGGSAASIYRLHVGNFPRPTAVFPPAGKPGEKLSVRWIGDRGGEFEQEITLPADGKPEAAIVAENEHGTAPSPNVMRVSDLPWINEAEPNNEVKYATVAAAVPLALNGIIEQHGDVDFFRFTAKKGQQLDVRVFARKPFRSPLDPLLSVHNDKGATIGSNDDTGGPDSYLRVAIPADGDYLVSMRDQLKRSGADFVYRVEITEAKPTLVMRLPERRQYISTTLVVPRNNHSAVMVAAQRQNFGGELNVTFGDLPAGMTFLAPPMAAGMTEIPVIFSATAEAQPAGALVDVIGKPADEKIAAVGHLDQRTMLVRGQNNIDVWGHNAERMATVLSEEIPYSLSLVQPKAPLVRNGTIDLKVVVKRAEGFTAPISLRLLYNPPGVASSGSILIPENQNEAVVPLTANNGAALGTWKIVMTGRVGSRFDRGGGGNRNTADDSLRCSTEFADLTVADQYYKVQFAKAAVEQGQETKLTVKIEKLRDFDGTAKAELVGLPANTTAPEVEFTKDTTELVFNVTANKDAKPGRYRSIVCVTKFPIDGDTVTHTLGGGELRVDAPLPNKVGQVAK